MSLTVHLAEAVFDGRALHPGWAVAMAGGRIAWLGPAAAAPPGPRQDHGPGLLAPGLVDLQVNGGGGRMLGTAPGLAEIAAICAAHRRLGSTGLLPTLISDRPETTAAVLAAGAEAARVGVPGFLGLHLEGPHITRAGAHDPALLRPMAEADCDAICAARATLPALMLTLAPEAATPAQIARLAAAGVTVSLGHSDCTAAQAAAAFAAGARAVTHLFNAMSPLAHRAPGLVGAALDDEGVWAGLIADGIHVVLPVLRVALAAKRGRDRLFLVSDAMAVAGTAAGEFVLGGRRVFRRDGRLALADGTLAGADLTLPQALAQIVALGVEPARALRMATSVPAACVGLAGRAGHLAPGRAADMVHLGPDLGLRAVWQGGAAQEGPWP